MSVQQIDTFSYKDIFSVEKVAFDNACTLDHTELQNTYSIYWIKKGNLNGLKQPVFSTKLCISV